MANEIKDKFSSSAALTITLASLASSSSAGRQSTIIDNTTARYADLIIYYKITLGTSPNTFSPVYFYLIRDDNDGTNHRDYGAGASDAALTFGAEAYPHFVAGSGSSATTGTVLQGSFVVNRPGAKWGIAVLQTTGAALNSTAGNHWIRYVGLNPEVQ